jgi:hypothetical protein
VGTPTASTRVTGDGGLSKPSTTAARGVVIGNQFLYQILLCRADILSQRHGT